jgi:hypothetical protein
MGSARRQFFFEIIERQWMKDRDVPSEFVFERRDLEAVHIKDVDLLAASDVEPGCLDWRVRRDRIAAIPERLFQKRRGRFNVTRGQREMGKAHGAVDASAFRDRKRTPLKPSGPLVAALCAGGTTPGGDTLAAS